MTRRSWAKGLRHGGEAATDNHRKSRGDKVELRRLVLDAIGAEQARVFDAFAGAGMMHRAVWHQAAAYVGCDKRPFLDDPRPGFVADNLRVLRAIDLAEWNVWDFDAYGSPWQQVTILAERRKLAPGERLGLVLTDGAAMRGRFGAVEGCLAELAGVRREIRGASTEWQGITGRALREVAQRMGGAVVEHWEADALTRCMLYSAAVVQAPGRP